MKTGSMSDFQSGARTAIANRLLKPDPALILCAVLLFEQAAAQSRSPGAMDETFTASSMDGAVRGLAVAPDTKILIIGDFTRIGGAERARVARLNPDGSLDGSFVPAPELWLAPSNRVSHVAVQSNGSVLLEGRFDLGSSGEPESPPCVVRLTKTGSIDGSFGPVTLEPMHARPPGYPTSLAMALQPDDKLVIAYDGCASEKPLCELTNLVRRITPDGRPDVTFSRFPGYGESPNRYWESPLQICVEPSGGSATLWSYLAVPCELVRFSAAGEELWRSRVHGLESSGGPIEPSVKAIASAEDGSLWVAGAYGRSVGTSWRDTVAVSRILPDGSWDPTCVDKSWSGPIYGLLSLPGRRALVSRNGTLIRLDSRAQVDPFWQRTALSASNVVLAQQADGKVLVGGGFKVGDRQNLARFFCDDRTPHQPAIRQPPAPQIVASTNQPFVLFVSADGYPYPSYQWFKNRQPMSGQTNDALLVAVEEASYHVVVSNPLGSVTSPEARVTVRHIPSVAEALDTPAWLWTAFDEYFGKSTTAWQVITGRESHDGVSAVSGRTPSIPGNLAGISAYLQTTVQGPGVLTYWIKSPEAEFYVNGERWTQLSTPAGQTANWVYRAHLLPEGLVSLQWWIKSSFLHPSSSLTLDEVRFQPMDPATVAPRIMCSFDHGTQRLLLLVAGRAEAACTLQISADLQHWQNWTNTIVKGATAILEHRIAPDQPIRFVRARVE